MSCAPSWKTKDDFSYNIFLFTIGFFLPLFILMITGIKIVNIIRKVGHKFLVFTFHAYDLFFLAFWTTENVRIEQRKQGKQSHRNGYQVCSLNWTFQKVFFLRFLSWYLSLSSAGDLTLFKAYYQYLAMQRYLSTEIGSVDAVEIMLSNIF